MNFFNKARLKYYYNDESAFLTYVNVYFVLLPVMSFLYCSSTPKLAFISGRNSHWLVA